MSQNTSHAVMAQRHEPHDSLDDFPTQPWATRALMESVVIPWCGPVSHMTVWEPAANRLHMATPLTDYYRDVWVSDIHDYGVGSIQHDFLLPFLPAELEGDHPDWIITNPPFRLAEQFIERASQLARFGFAMIVRTSFLEGVGRYHNIFRKNPPSIVAQFAERVPMVKGRLTATGSTATAYCWLVWVDGTQFTQFNWIPPCRKHLERDGDYPDCSEVAA